MATFFFFGTLRHIPLLEAVLGRAVDAGTIRPAALLDHQVSRVKDADYPMIARAAGAQADGILVEDLTDADIDRMDFYEGGFGYALRQMIVTVDGLKQQAEVYFPEPGKLEPDGPWDLQTWADAHGALMVRTAREYLRLMGRASEDEAVSLFPFIKARAWAGMLAGKAAPATLRHTPAQGDVVLTERPEGYEGFFALRRFDVSKRLFDGGMSQPYKREAFVAYDAALILPYDPVLDQVALIEQLRYGPAMRGDPAPWVLEPVAGLVEAGEDPETCARREAEEEAGLTIQRVEPILMAYPSPGYSTEFFHMFLGVCDLTLKSEQGGGLASENEDIRTHRMPLDQALSLIDSGEINCAPLALMLLWLARHRDRLRAG